MAQAARDQNFVTTLLAVSSADGVTPVVVYADPVTHRLLTDLASGSGTVTSVSVVSANGFAGSVATATTTPAITLSTTITGILSGNGTAISAASTTGSGSVVLATSPVLTTPNLGTPSALVATNATGTAAALSIGGTAAVSTTSTIANEAADTTCFVNFTTAATGDLGIKSNAGLTFNSNTGALTATSFVGSITGNAATVTFANEATDTTCFIAFGTAATGSLPVSTNTNMTFNSSTGVATFASTVLTTTDINGGTIDGTTIGASSATTIIGTTIQANTSFLPDADGGAALGSATLGFSILGLSSGSTINFANSNVVLTHSSGILTMGTGELRITNAGTNTASVVTVGGTQTLTAKTLTSPTINTATLGGTSIFAEGGAIAYDAASSADGVYTGFVRAGTAGTTLAFGDLVYLAAADSRWELADADAATTSDRFLGMCVLAAANDGDPTTILLTGFIRADAAFPAMTIGSAMYVGETAGDIQVAIPTGADNVIRRVGYAWTADELYFNPSMDSQITVA